MTVWFCKTKLLHQLHCWVSCALKAFSLTQADPHCTPVHLCPPEARHCFVSAKLRTGARAVVSPANPSPAAASIPHGRWYVCWLLHLIQLPDYGLGQQEGWPSPWALQTCGRTKETANLRPAQLRAMRYLRSEPVNVRCVLQIKIDLFLKKVKIKSQGSPLMLLFSTQQDSWPQQPLSGHQHSTGSPKGVPGRDPCLLGTEFREHWLPSGHTSSPSLPWWLTAMPG